jgi:hypothetical protein
MATVTEIRQQLVQGGMTPEDAQKAAGILADMPAFTSPAGAIWDTLRAKNFEMIARPINTTFRFLTDHKKNIIVVTKDGMNTVFVETAIESL